MKFNLIRIDIDANLELGSEVQWNSLLSFILKTSENARLKITVRLSQYFVNDKIMGPVTFIINNRIRHDPNSTLSCAVVRSHLAPDCISFLRRF